MTTHNEEPGLVNSTPVDDDRRKFLATCGKFAVVTPPALSILLSTSLNSEAIAQSGGRGDNNRGDHGHHHHRHHHHHHHRPDGDHDGHGDRDFGNREFAGWLERLLDRMF
jgi:hypothetical protein